MALTDLEIQLGELVQLAAHAGHEAKHLWASTTEGMIYQGCMSSGNEQRWVCRVPHVVLKRPSPSTPLFSRRHLPQGSAPPPAGLHSPLSRLAQAGGDGHKPAEARAA